MPQVIRIGGSGEIYGNLKVIADAVSSSDSGFSLNFGAEYLLGEKLALRAGFKSGWNSNVSAGFGFNLAGLKIDYAFVPYGLLCITCL
ncbi:MAG: hypothetical protein AB1633_00595 [Elusimicrobiota bacterium]